MDWQTLQLTRHNEVFILKFDVDGGERADEAKRGIIEEWLVARDIKYIGTITLIKVGLSSFAVAFHFPLFFRATSRTMRVRFNTN